MPEHAVEIEAKRAAELLGVDVYTLGWYLRRAASERLEGLARRTREAFSRGVSLDDLELNEDEVDGIRNLVSAAAACERAHAAEMNEAS